MHHRSFTSLGLSDATLTQLDRAGFRAPTPIQGAVIPDALAGRDVAATAPTGSGKTLAFGLPVLATLPQAAPRRPTGLVLVPTRELAAQIVRDLEPFARVHDRSVTAVYGGTAPGPQRRALAAGADLVVACPGRLEDLLGQGALRLDAVCRVVVDEADRLADMGFLPAVRRILAATAERRQTLLFSATLDGESARLAREHQTDPVSHEVAPAPTAASDVRHLFWSVPRTARPSVTAEVIDRMGSTVVFCRTRHGADRLARQLARHGVTSVAIHGGRSQGQRDRALRDFRSGKASALVASDVAARGIHVEGVAGVVHYDPAGDPATYLHRSGRTGRAGQRGVVVSLVDPDADATAPIRRKLGIEGRVSRVDLNILTTTSPPAGDDAVQEGTVGFFNEARGYGFISRPSGDDLFVHHSQLADGVDTLEIGQRVAFRIAAGRRGPEAAEVRIV